jgi:hypothetical protein
MNPARVVTPGAPVAGPGRARQLRDAWRQTAGRTPRRPPRHPLIRLSFRTRSAIGDDNHPVGIGPPICPGGRPLPIGGPDRDESRRMASWQGQARAAEVDHGYRCPPAAAASVQTDEPQPGHEQLTPREREVLRMIAARLQPRMRSPNTISNHIASISPRPGSQPGPNWERSRSGDSWSAEGDLHATAHRLHGPPHSPSSRAAATRSAKSSPRSRGQHARLRGPSKAGRPDTPLPLTLRRASRLD